MYTQEQIDHVHDTLIDLLISCMRSGYIPHEKPKIGDWCYECSTLSTDRNRDCRIGILLEDLGEGNYTTKTIGDKIIDWHNADMVKIPSKYLR